MKVGDLEIIKTSQIGYNECYRILRDQSKSFTVPFLNNGEPFKESPHTISIMGDDLCALFPDDFSQEYLAEFKDKNGRDASIACLPIISGFAVVADMALSDKQKRQSYRYIKSLLAEFSWGVEDAE